MYSTNQPHSFIMSLHTNFRLNTDRGPAKRTTHLSLLVVKNIRTHALLVESVVAALRAQQGSRHTVEANHTCTRVEQGRVVRGRPKGAIINIGWGMKYFAASRRLEGNVDCDSSGIPPAAHYSQNHNQGHACNRDSQEDGRAATNEMERQECTANNNGQNHC